MMTLIFSIKPQKKYNKTPSPAKMFGRDFSLFSVFTGPVKKHRKKELYKREYSDSTIKIFLPRGIVFCTDFMALKE